MSEISREDFERLERKIDKVNDNLSSKWTLPVSLAILGALLSLVSFFIEQNVVKSNITISERNKIVGKAMGEDLERFYNDVWNLLIDIDEQFESYSLGLEKVESDKLDSLLMEFHETLNKQRLVDQEVINLCKEYKEYVSESALDLSTKVIPSSNAKRVYLESKTLHQKAVNAVKDYTEKLGS
ncbi:MAG: hypothetical protein AAF620_16740 [Bacteroidota bacterium]